MLGRREVPLARVGILGAKLPFESSTLGPHAHFTMLPENLCHFLSKSGTIRLCDVLHNSALLTSTSHTMIFLIWIKRSVPNPFTKLFQSLTHGNVGRRSFFLLLDSVQKFLHLFFQPTSAKKAANGETLLHIIFDYARSRRTKNRPQNRPQTARRRADYTTTSLVRGWTR